MDLEPSRPLLDYHHFLYWQKLLFYWSRPTLIYHDSEGIKFRVCGCLVCRPSALIPMNRGQIFIMLFIYLQMQQSHHYNDFVANRTIHPVCCLSIILVQRICMQNCINLQCFRCHSMGMFWPFLVSWQSVALFLSALTIPQPHRQTQTFCGKHTKSVYSNLSGTLLAIRLITYMYMGTSMISLSGQIGFMLVERLSFKGASTCLLHSQCP